MVWLVAAPWCESKLMYNTIILIMNESRYPLPPNKYVYFDSDFKWQHWPRYQWNSIENVSFQTYSKRRVHCNTNWTLTDGHNKLKARSTHVVAVRLIGLLVPFSLQAFTVFVRNEITQLVLPGGGNEARTINWNYLYVYNYFFLYKDKDKENNISQNYQKRFFRWYKILRSLLN